MILPTITEEEIMSLNDPYILYCMQLGMENLGIFQNNVVFFLIWLFLILVEPLVQFQEQMFNIIPNVPIMFSQ
jgi:hypothetical protein